MGKGNLAIIRYSALAALVLIVAGAAVAQQEVRVYASPGTDGAATFQWNQSQVRGRYVCPACGYSTNDAAVVTCPDLWSAHGGSVALIDTYGGGLAGSAATGAGRIINTVLTSLGFCDILYADGAGTMQYESVIGRPFNPGDHVYARAASDGTYWALGDHIRFLFSDPGVGRVAAQMEQTSGLVPPGFEISCCPFRVTDGEVVQVRYQVGTGRFQLYSDLDGLDYDNLPGLGGDQYTATGAFRFMIPVGAPSFAARFTVHSNSVIIPNTAEAPVPAGIDFVAGAPAIWDDPILTPRGLYLSAVALGANVIGDSVTGTVVETGAAVANHYAIPAGALGVGHTRVLFRDASEYVWRYNINSAGDAMDGLPAGSVPGGPGIPVPSDHGPVGEEVQPADAAWISSRVHVPVTRRLHGGVPETWRNGPAEPNNASTGYPRFLVGYVDGSRFVDEAFAPGASAQRDFQVRNSWSTGGTAYLYQCTGCGAFLDSTQTGTNWDVDAPNDCPYCLTNIPGTPSHVDGGVTLADQMVTSLTTPPGVTTPGRPNVRPQIPASAIKLTSTAGSSGKLTPGQRMLRTVCIDIPKYQPPSDPTGGLNNDLTSNWGYRGMMMTYHDANGNGQWDVFYRDPLSGDTLDPDTPIGTAYDPPHTHAYCPTCGAVFYGPQIPGFCPFDGDGLTSVSNEVAESHLACEEFDVYDLQISVLKEAEIAHAGDTVDIGRVSPGIDAGLLDTTVAAAGGLPPGRSAFGTNVSAGATVTRNEGNIADQMVPAAGGAELTARTLGRWLQANPVVPDSFSWWLDSTGGIFPPYGGQAGGWGHTGGAQEGLGAAAWPVPLGQASGNYAGQYVAYLETNGVGGLQYIDRSTGAVLTEGDVNGDGVADNVFDPRVDEPLEPVFAFDARLRVAESRFPYNDYYGADAAPTVRFDYDGTGAVSNLQVLWTSNRNSVSGSGGVIPGGPAPPGSGPGDTATADYPHNILLVNAGPIGPGAPSNYRGFAWLGGAATAVTADNVGTNPGAVNGAPATYSDLSGDQWLFWHRSLTSTQGVQSVLQFDSDPAGTGAFPNAPAYLYASGYPYENICGFSDPLITNPTTGNPYHWLFWNSGPEGRERLFFRWAWDPGDTATANNEGSLPLDNSAAAGTVSSVVPDYGSGVSIRKPSHGPFVYAKDPSAFYWNAGAGAAPQAHVFFSGYLRHQENADICWARYAMVDPVSGAILMTNPTANYGKLTFPRVENNDRLPAIGWTGVTPTDWPGEVMDSDGMRQVFSTLHLDWLVHDDGAGDDFGSAPSPALGDPQFYIGLVYDDGSTDMYAISWSEPNAYDQARGVYRILSPMTTALGTVTVDPLPVLPALEIDPASGAVVFATPLFNPSTPADLSCALNTTPTGSGGAGLPAGLTDVVLYADYTPFIWRLTTEGAADDCPNAFLETDPSGSVVEQKRLSVFWRRSHAAADPPHFGRTSFMYRAWTLSVQVNRPPISSVGGIAIYDPTVPGFVPYGGATYVNAADGIITFDPGTEGEVFSITYDSAVDGGTYTETHRVLGWSEEVPVAVDTVASEGPLSVSQEVYPVASGLPGTAISAVRYWLFWSSSRALYDLRLPVANGSDLKQTADIYCATVVPDYATLVPQW